jgi:hypothetical protein
LFDEFAPASFPDFGADGVLELPELLLLPELLPELLDDEEEGGATHEPWSHVSEQQSPNLVHDAPSPLQVAPVPPQTPSSQSRLQHCPLVEQVVPSARQLGVGDEPDDEPDEEPPDADGESVGAMHTPEQARLQQSDHEAHVAPSSAHCPPVPPSLPQLSQGLAAALAAHPAATTISAPSAIAFPWFMPGLIATDVPPRRRAHHRERTTISRRVRGRPGTASSIRWLGRDP